MVLANSNCSRYRLHLVINLDSFFSGHGAYALFFLAGIGLIVLGAERIVSGIKAEKSRRKYRILNIGIG